MGIAHRPMDVKSYINLQSVRLETRLELSVFITVGRGEEEKKLQKLILCLEFPSQNKLDGF